MRIAQWKPKSAPSNYGDALNAYLWPKVLHKDTLSYLPDGMFYGIGTVLGDPAHTKPASHHIVMGSGAGYFGSPVRDKTWNIYFVRGPHTAKLMRNCLSVTDPAILMGNYFEKQDVFYDCSFMPRWDSVSPELEHGCKDADINLIKPTDSVEHVTNEISRTGLLLTEALHGAVVADTLRVPWISIRVSPDHDFKWRDWCGSLDMIWNPIDAEKFGLTWARKFAVPQLSAASVSNKRLLQVENRIVRLNNDIARGVRI